MTDVIVRWAGPSDTASGSTYKIERTLDNTTWTTLVASQAATTPYASLTDTISGNVTYGTTSIVLTDGSLGASGYAWIDDALIQWTGLSVKTLTGVIWHSGYGTYATGTVCYKAHESYTDAGVTITNNVALYRITHINSSGILAAPTYLWYYYPPTPASSRHCVVIASIATDLGIEARSGLGVQASLASDKEFADSGGAHLDKGQSTAKTGTTNTFGLAFFHCWKNSARSPITDNDAAYIFVLDSASADKLTVTVDTIPDRDWVLLSQVATSAV